MPTGTSSNRAMWNHSVIVVSLLPDCRSCCQKKKRKREENCCCPVDGFGCSLETLKLKLAAKRQQKPFVCPTFGSFFSGNALFSQKLNFVLCPLLCSALRAVKGFSHQLQHNLAPNIESESELRLASFLILLLCICSNNSNMKCSWPTVLYAKMCVKPQIHTKLALGRLELSFWWGRGDGERGKSFPSWTDCSPPVVSPMCNCKMFFFNQLQVYYSWKVPRVSSGSRTRARDTWTDIYQSVSFDLNWIELALLL